MINSLSLKSLYEFLSLTEQMSKILVYYLFNGALNLSMTSISEKRCSQSSLTSLSCICADEHSCLLAVAWLEWQMAWDLYSLGGLGVVNRVLTNPGTLFFLMSFNMWDTERNADKWVALKSKDLRRRHLVDTINYKGAQHK